MPYQHSTPPLRRAAPLAAALFAALLLAACGGGGGSSSDSAPAASAGSDGATGTGTGSGTGSGTDAGSGTGTGTSGSGSDTGTGTDNGSGSTPTPTPTSYDWSALATRLDASVGSDSGQVAGYSFAVAVSSSTASNSRYTRGGGNLASTARVALASASKGPTALLVLSLVRDGLLDLDMPVVNYLGSDISWPAAKSAITLRMLLDHTSGIPYSSACLSDTASTLAACTQEIADTALVFPPGTRFGYSGAGYQVVGYVAQQVSGVAWNTLFRQRIGTPLGSGLSWGDSTQNPRIAGGAVASTDDYVKLLQMLLDGGLAADGTTRLLDAAQVQSLQRSEIDGLPVYYTPAPASAGLHGYSLGWWITDTASHPGSAGPELSNPGLLGSLPWVDFDRRYAAVLLTNSDTDTATSIWGALRPLILDQVNAVPN
ncbi:serine hydrolase domain-containing protein [Hydrocarboniphaga sp.]|uniref:serine hydrolase domain-containing protein n=1 Tax=Hydrocarboniphaga sp. TaxID=2033016 RepID=UPI003D11AEEB